jgi:hypothetical protein
LTNIRGFSVELESKKYMRNVTITNNYLNKVLLEGELGDIIHLSMIDGEVLEIVGQYGVIRIDVKDSELRKLTSPPIEKCKGGKG